MQNSSVLNLPDWAREYSRQNHNNQGSKTNTTLHFASSSSSSTNLRAFSHCCLRCWGGAPRVLCCCWGAGPAMACFAIYSDTMAKAYAECWRVSSAVKYNQASIKAKKEMKVANAQGLWAKARDLGVKELSAYFRLPYHEPLCIAKQQIWNSFNFQFIAGTDPFAVMIWRREASYQRGRVGCSCGGWLNIPFPKLL